MKKGTTRKLVTSAMCLALCILLPFLTMQIPTLGNMLLPMHIPVLLCGFVCGPWYGLAVGATAPLLRSALVHMPPFFPVASAMAFELAAYGFFSGLLYAGLPKKKSSVYVSLISSMVIGRVVWGVVMAFFSGISGSEFGWKAFISGSVLTAIPGIVIQIILIPVIVFAIERSGSKTGK